MTSSRSPIHFTNELEVAAAPQRIWSLPVDPKAWPSFYPGVKHVQLLDGHESLRFGRRFETNVAGQDVFASVQEVVPFSRIAWGGYPKVSAASRLITLGLSHLRRMVATFGPKRRCRARTGSSWRRGTCRTRWLPQQRNGRSVNARDGH
jgi:hypothetical protein